MLSHILTSVFLQVKTQIHKVHATKPVAIFFCLINHNLIVRKHNSGLEHKVRVVMQLCA